MHSAAGLRPDPLGSAPQTLSGFRGPISKGRGSREEKKSIQGTTGRERKGGNLSFSVPDSDSFRGPRIKFPIVVGIFICHVWLCWYRLLISGWFRADENV